MMVRGPGRYCGSEFDVLCLEHARENVVEVRTQTQCQTVIFDEAGQACGVLAKPRGGEAEEISCRVVIDASGRSTVIGSQLDLKTDVAGLDKAAVWSYYRAANAAQGSMLEKQPCL
ncbi:MAG: hypothetical protein R3C56_34305 [Pirellulaceae bacterium]